MSRLLNLLSLPFIALISLPLLSFAAFTTSLAFAALLIRVSAIYVDLALALLQSALSPSAPSDRPGSEKIPLPPGKHSSRPPVLRDSSTTTTSNGTRHRSSHASSASSPTIPDFTAHNSNSNYNRTSSFASLVGTGPSRDYEGVGGWRISASTTTNTANNGSGVDSNNNSNGNEDNEDDDDEAVWMGMNRRLELPALSMPSPTLMVGRNSLRRSSLSTGNSGSGVNSGIGLRASPGIVRNVTGMTLSGTRSSSGTASPAGYFGVSSPGGGSHHGAGFGHGLVVGGESPGVMMGMGLTRSSVEGGGGGYRSEAASRRTSFGSRSGSVSMVKMAGLG